MNPQMAPIYIVGYALFFTGSMIYHTVRHRGYWDDWPSDILLTGMMSAGWPMWVTIAPLIVLGWLLGAVVKACLNIWRDPQ